MHEGIKLRIRLLSSRQIGVLQQSWSSPKALHRRGNRYLYTKYGWHLRECRDAGRCRWCSERLLQIPGKNSDEYNCVHSNSGRQLYLFDNLSKKFSWYKLIVWGLLYYLRFASGFYGSAAILEKAVWPILCLFIRLQYLQNIAILVIACIFYWWLPLL